MDQKDIEQAEADAKRTIAMWETAGKNAHEQASEAIKRAGEATDKLQSVQKELAVAEKQFAEIQAKVREITKLAGA